MVNIKSILFLIILVLNLISFSIYSQDLHYSQYFNTPLNLNPALTAYSQADYRLILNNRNQWASVTVPYKTFSGSFDMKVLNRKKESDFFGVGLIFNKDEAGDSKYGTTQIGLSLSWVKSLSRKNRNIISLGIQSSYFQRSIDYSQLYFPEQWDGTSSQMTNNHSETFYVSSFSFFDFAAGVHHLFAPSRKFKLNSGVSVWHINRPNQSLMNDEQSKLNIKIQVYSEPEIILDKPYNIIPSVMYTYQGPYQELIFGFRLHYKIHKTRERYFAMSTGVYGRNKDAMILYAGMDYKNARLAITYDLNLSPLKAASQYRGGMEISLKWLFYKGNKIKKMGPTPCPIF